MVVDGMVVDGIAYKVSKHATPHEKIPEP